MNKVTRTGGARVGWVNATWPFAKLVATAKALKLNVLFIGKYEFHTGQIINLKKYGFIPILASGIKIEHNVATYPQSIIFWTFGSPEKLIESIEHTGLLIVGPEINTNSISQNKGSPVKIMPVITAIIIWNLLFFADQNYFLGHTPSRLGVFSIIALALLFATALAIKKNTIVANVFLKPGRSVGEIMPILNLLMLVTGAMSIMLTFF